MKESKKIIEKSLKVGGGGDIVGGVLKTPLRYHRRGWVGSKIQILPKFMFQISECMCFGAILISAGGIGLRGAVQKMSQIVGDVHNFLDPPPLG